MKVYICMSINGQCPCIQCGIDGIECEFNKKMHKTRDTKYLCDKAREYCEKVHQSEVADVSDYITREQVIDVLKETGIIQDNDLGHLVVDEISRIPTVDEKEIIRNTVERIVERLEEEIELVVTQFPLQGKYIKKTRAIEIVKEEGGTSD